MQNHQITILQMKEARVSATRKSSPDIASIRVVIISRVRKATMRGKRQRKEAEAVDRNDQRGPARDEREKDA